MSTRSRIGYVTDDGKVISIYCHWDGYPSNNGSILLKHYTDKEKVARLISLGDISCLEAEIEPKAETAPSRYADMSGDGEKKMVKHSFDTPQEGVVVAYGRDRGEDPETIKPRIDESVDEFVKSDVEEWGYLFKDGKWFVIDGHVGEQSQKLEPLTLEYIRDSE
jgi:hypothetical protein